MMRGMDCKSMECFSKVIVRLNSYKILALIVGCQVDGVWGDNWSCWLDVLVVGLLSGPPSTLFIDWYLSLSSRRHDSMVMDGGSLQDIQERILTNALTYRIRGFHMVSALCPFCDSSSEELDHILNKPPKVITNFGEVVNWWSN
ncbi:hypothetical protein Tco_1530909 [Tanacetum coccineum]